MALTIRIPTWTIPAGVVGAVLFLGLNSLSKADVRDITYKQNLYPTNMQIVDGGLYDVSNGRITKPTAICIPNAELRKRFLKSDDPQSYVLKNLLGQYIPYISKVLKIDSEIVDKSGSAYQIEISGLQRTYIVNQPNSYMVALTEEDETCLKQFNEKFNERRCLAIVDQVVRLRSSQQVIGYSFYSNCVIPNPGGTRAFMPQMPPKHPRNLGYYLSMVKDYLGLLDDSQSGAIQSANLASISN